LLNTYDGTLDLLFVQPPNMSYPIQPFLWWSQTALVYKASSSTATKTPLLLEGQSNNSQDTRTTPGHAQPETH